MPRRVLKGVGLATLAALVAVVVLAAIPVGTSGLVQSRPAPLATPEAARQAIDRIVASEAGVRSDCHSRVIEPPKPPERVIVLFHGLNACPRQFARLGEQLAAKGYAVYIPLLPMHGLAGADASALADMAAGDLRRLAERSVDIAHGLAPHVWVMGASAGGVVAAWIGQVRGDVDGAVAIAPALGLADVPSFVTSGATNLLSRIPNVPLPFGTSLPWTYSGTSTHAVAETFRFGQAVRELARAEKPAARVLAVVFNEADGTISNDLAAELAATWEAHGAVVERASLPATLHLPHDLVDPDQPRGDPAVVYPKLIELVSGGP